MSSIKITSISNQAGTGGATISGISTVTANKYAKLPVGTSAQRVGIESGSIRYNTDESVMEFYNGSTWLGISSRTLSEERFLARGVFGGGDPTTNTIDYITIATAGNTTDFGDLTVARNNLAACSSSIRGVFGGGYVFPTASATNTIDYITIATAGDATDFGDLTVARSSLAACSSSTRGVFGGGITPTPAPAGLLTNTLDYITIATTGNATDFGDLTVALGRFSLAACSSSTRGVFGGGAPDTNTIDYITIATAGDATDFGDLTSSRQLFAACSSSTRGVFGGGATSPGTTNTIDYITIATAGNATDFGDLTVARQTLAACSSSTRGVFGGGAILGGSTNTIDYITVATTGNATDFGDLTVTRILFAACSNSHGGLLSN